MASRALKNWRGIHEVVKPLGREAAAMMGGRRAAVIEGDLSANVPHAAERSMQRKMAKLLHMRRTTEKRIEEPFDVRQPRLIRRRTGRRQ